jgi:GT2 family glycosyltransferase
VTPIRISVVVPTLDTRALTTACVDAVFASPLPAGVELQVVVVDDGSRDGTADAFAARPGVHVVKNASPTGFSRAVNSGVAASTGDLLVVLNSDATVEPGSLGQIVEAFEADPTVGIVGARLRYPDGTPQWSGGREPDLLWLFAQASGFPALLGRLPVWRRLKPLHPESPVDVDWVSGAAMAVRASVWRDLGPFDSTYAFYGQDLDLCLRARDRGWRVRLIPGFQALHHQGATISVKSETPIGSAAMGLLWSDFVLWAGKRKGPAFARRARKAIRAGSFLRIAARKVLLPFVALSRRNAWQSETGALAAARSALAART